MKVEMFLALLTTFSTITGLAVESIKKVLGAKYNISYNLVAVIVALCVGIGGTFVYYALAHIIIDYTEVIYAVLMGLASALSSMVSATSC